MDHARLIDALGGVRGLQARFEAAGEQGLNKARLRKWKEKNHIPWRWRPAVAAMAAQEKLELPPDFVADFLDTTAFEKAG